MDREELILTTAKELVIKMLETKNLNLNLRGGNDAISDLGERLNIMTKKVAESLESLNK